MKQDKRRGLTRIALALALAGYCVTPLALAEDSAWIESGETNIFQGDYSVALFGRRKCYDRCRPCNVDF